MREIQYSLFQIHILMENQFLSIDALKGELFSGAYYISPELPRNFMINFIESLKTRKNIGFQVNKPYAEYDKYEIINNLGEK